MWAKVNSDNVVTTVSVKPDPYNATPEVDLSSVGWYWLKQTQKPQETVQLKAVDITKDNAALIENNQVVQQWSVIDRPVEEQPLYATATVNFPAFRTALMTDEHFINWMVAVLDSPDTVDNVYLNNLRDAALLGNVEAMQSQYDLLKQKLPPTQEAITAWQSVSDQYLNGLFVA